MRTGIWIYALVDPRTGKFRYIGKTVQELTSRLSAHIYDKSPSHRANWIKSLLVLGLRPQITPVQMVPGDDPAKWQEAERYWISFFRGFGSLTNQENGGLGGDRGKRSAETIEKMRLANLGKRHTAQTRAKMSLVRKGRKHSAAWALNISEAQKRRYLTIRGASLT